MASCQRPSRSTQTRMLLYGLPPRTGACLENITAASGGKSTICIESTGSPGVPMPPSDDLALRLGADRGVVDDQELVGDEARPDFGVGLPFHHLGFLPRR